MLPQIPAINSTHAMPSKSGVFDLISSENRFPTRVRHLCNSPPPRVAMHLLPDTSDEQYPTDATRPVARAKFNACRIPDDNTHSSVCPWIKTPREPSSRARMHSPKASFTRTLSASSAETPPKEALQTARLRPRTLLRPSRGLTRIYLSWKFLRKRKAISTRRTRGKRARCSATSITRAREHEQPKQGIFRTRGHLSFTRLP